jgi:DNA polymerase III delta prime subunit
LQPAVFPGRQAVLSTFQRSLATGGLSQSYLFVGPEGSGKEVTALEIARSANCRCATVCTDPDLCESCQKAVSFQHPDIRWLGPAPATANAVLARELLAHKREDCFYQPAYAASTQISIGDPDDPGPLTIRSLLRFLRVHSFQGRYKVAVVVDSHRLTAEAANSLLKTLEEPPPASLIFLLTTNRTAMLPTILSRCQQVRFDPYPEEELVTLLRERQTCDAETARVVARAADGNVRKAMALLRPQMAALLNWAGYLMEWIHAGRTGAVHLAADALHNGRIPAVMVDTGEGTQEDLGVRPTPVPLQVPSGRGVEEIREASDLPSRRERAIQLCEMLNLYYSEVLTCRERGEEWVPRLAYAADRIRAWAQRRQTSTLLRDIARVESAKADIDRNLNIGLTMAVLGEGLLSHAKQDQKALGARA